MRHDRLTMVLAIAVLLTLAAAPSSAVEQGWLLRVNGTWDDSGVGATIPNGDGSSVGIDGQSGYGLGIAGEYRFSDRLGLELGTQWCTNDVDIRVDDPGGGFLTASDTMTPITLTAGLDIHLTPQSRTDLYFAPLVAFVNYNNRMTFTAGGDQATVTVDDELTYGAALGVNYPMGDRGWTFSTNVRYLDANVEFTDDDGDRLKIANEPLSVGLGFGYRF